MVINEFQTDPVLITLSDKHHAWHTPGGAHGFPSRTNPAGSPGSGMEFFNFHRNLMDDFFAWNNTHAAVPTSLLVPWTSIPAALKATSLWNATFAAQELRLTTNTPPFATADELGIYIETGIHNQFLHGATAQAFSEPVVGTLHSPQSTFFYQIHGLVNYWWNLWFPSKPIIKDVIDHKLHIVEKLRVKEFVKEHDKLLAKEHIKDRVKEVIKEKDKDIWEGGFVEQIDDPVILTQLKERLRALEIGAAQRKHFIRAGERPAVEKAAARRASRRRRR